MENNLLNKNILIYGISDSGISAAKFAYNRDANVSFFDDKKKDFDLKKHDICYAEQINVLNDETVKNIDLVVVSPGVPIIGNARIEFLKNKNIEIISEFGFGLNFLKGKTVFITGTNGKTTTTSLIGQILKTQYKKVFVCGNIGLPITSIVENTTDDSITVVEVSSYMIETTKTINPNVSLLLNITEDHIIRHKTFKEYKKQKLRICDTQTSENYCILNKDIKAKTNAKKIIFNLKTKDDCAYCENGYIYYNNKRLFSTKIIKLIGEKNIENVLASVCACKCLNITNAHLKYAIKHFKPIEHRLETVKKCKGITYINDSKATNPDSTVCALLAMKEPVILLLGGSFKDTSFNPIFKYADKIKTIIAYGQTKDQIISCAKANKFFKILEADNLTYAFEKVQSVVRKGDTVLLSPACASFDEFENYEHRGRFFKELVGGIK